jgi:hypothetical protein
MASLLAGQVKKFATGEGVAREILYDLKTFTLVAV